MPTDLTIGSWLTEADSAFALDAALAAADLWQVYPEVCGVLAQPKPSQLSKGIRIDRVLVPNDRLLGLGWRHGIVGIEIKKSNEKIGPAIAQAMDYSRGVWTLPPGNIKVWLDWVFVWPMARQEGTTASILAQNRIGSAHADNYTSLHLKSGEQNVIKIHHSYAGQADYVDIGEALNGRKVGNRG